MTEQPTPGAGQALAVAAAGTALVLVAFTIPLVTLTSTAASLGAGVGAQAWVLSSWTTAALVTAGFSLLGAVAVLLARQRPARSAAPAPAVVVTSNSEAYVRAGF